MSKTKKKINRAKNPVYIPNQPFNKGGNLHCYFNDDNGYDKRESERT